MMVFALGFTLDAPFAPRSIRMMVQPVVLNLVGLRLELKGAGLGFLAFFGVLVSGCYDLRLLIALQYSTIVH
jgi:hypothetical protein